jgi:hypothetical protein
MVTIMPVMILSVSMVISFLSLDLVITVIIKEVLVKVATDLTKVDKVALATVKEEKVPMVKVATDRVVTGLTKELLTLLNSSVLVWITLLIHAHANLEPHNAMDTQLSVLSDQETLLPDISALSLVLKLL